MADSKAFEWLCENLEQTTHLDRLEARGTVRLAMKGAGLEPKQVGRDQLQVVLEKLMPSELEGRGVEGSDAVCQALITRLGEIGEDESTHDSPEAIFARMA
jgi:hypothetical protein